MGPKIDGMVSTLRRKLTKPRIELAAHRFGYAMFLHWRRVARSEIAVFDYMIEHKPKDVFLPNLYDVQHYLETCLNSGQRPTSHQIAIRICPWIPTEEDDDY